MSPENQLPDILLLQPEEEAERLWKGAREAFRDAGESLVALSECLDLGIRAAVILTIRRVQEGRDRFPATIASQLAAPPPEIDVERDAVETPRTLHFREVLDLLSGEDLPCVAPGMHRGWEDRRFSCRRSRETARERTGVTLGAGEQERLLFLLACHNRLFHYPPPVRLEPPAVLAAFPTLEGLVERLRGGKGS